MHPGSRLRARRGDCEKMECGIWCLEKFCSVYASLVIVEFANCKLMGKVFLVGQNFLTSLQGAEPKLQVFAVCHRGSFGINLH